MHRLAVGSGLAVLALLLTGCGSDDKLGAKPDLPTTTPALWNPCDALDAAFVKRTFGTDAREDDGEPTAPVCRFAPQEKTGQPLVTANYLLFSGTLEEAWKTMGQPKNADVTSPRIAAADDSRVVVAVVKKQLYVDGFVQNGDLIQQVEVVAPPPYDENRVVAGVRATLTRMSQHADRAGVTESSDPQ